MEHEFKVGDKIEWRGWTTVITEVESNKIWGVWTRPSGILQKTKTYLSTLTNLREIRLIEPAMMQYDPTQQGEEDDSI